MRTYLDCIPCFVNQALKAARQSTASARLQKEVLNQVMSELSEFDFNKKPPFMARQVYKTVKKVTGNSDPFREIKERDNRQAMALLPEARGRINASSDPLLFAVKTAIAGNIMDFGPGSQYNVEKTIESVLSRGFGIDNYKEFKEDISRAKTVCYLADNAGEIVFDRLLAENIRANSDCRILFYVKKKPIINDATREDAVFAGLDRISGLEIRALETRQEPEFQRSLGESDLTVSKGQGNYEALSEASANIYFLLIAKCPVIARDLGVKVGETVLKAGRKREVKK